MIFRPQVNITLDGERVEKIIVEMQNYKKHICWNWGRKEKLMLDVILICIYGFLNNSQNSIK